MIAGDSAATATANGTLQELIRRVDQLAFARGCAEEQAAEGARAGADD